MERGTEQGLHKDAWYNCGIKRGGCVGVSFAFDIMDSSNGGYMYVPGSHRWSGLNISSNASSRTDARRSALQSAQQCPYMDERIERALMKRAKTKYQAHARSGVL